MRLRYGGSADRGDFAMYLASKDGYEDTVLSIGVFAGPPEDALVFGESPFFADEVDLEKS